MSAVVQTRINETLRNDLERIAAERYEGNLSMVVRLALKEFRDRHRPHAHTREKVDPVPSSSE